MKLVKQIFEDHKSGGYKKLYKEAMIVRLDFLKEKSLWWPWKIKTYEHLA